MKKLILLLFAITFQSCHSQNKETMEPKVKKTDAEWKKQLTPEQYYVLRQNGTEAKFSSALNKNYGKGVYVCAACNTPLFKSENKYDSGSGWPSFDREVEDNVAFSTDSFATFI